MHFAMDASISFSSKCPAGSSDVKISPDNLRVISAAYKPYGNASLYSLIYSTHFSKSDSLANLLARQADEITKFSA